jgi:molybdopterin synthase sulfur carrier subunit
MAVVIRIPTPLRKFTDGQAEVEVEGATVKELFANLEQSHAGLGAKIFDDSGEIRRFINVFVNGDDVRHVDGLATAVKSGDEVSVIPAIAGGRRD